MAPSRMLKQMTPRGSAKIAEPRVFSWGNTMLITGRDSWKQLQNLLSDVSGECYP
jgi:hypothetical protein